MREKMTYRDYLILTAAHTAESLGEAIKTALSMDSEEYAISYLERKLDTARVLVQYEHASPERVEARPTFREEEQ